MKKLRNRFERFCFRHRNWGIPNLMLYICIGSAVVYFMSQFAGNWILYDYLRFDLEKILQGQVWRLFSYVLTMENGDILFTLLMLVCYYSLGRAMEMAWGTFRFNLFYLSGVVLLDAFVLLLALFMPELIPFLKDNFVSVSALNLSLFIGYATLYPNAQFLVLFIIPVKAWIFALVYLGLTFYNVFQLSFPVFLFPINLLPLVSLANYFLFFGKDVLNVIPMSWRVNASRLFRKKPKRAAPRTGTIPFQSAGSYQAATASVKAPYTHRCEVCGRTDVSHPELEFRYCSKCNGYHCYCQEHISSHTHVE